MSLRTRRPREPAVNVAAPIDSRSVWSPAKIGIGWMLGTMAVYLVLGDTEGVGNLHEMVLFVLIATGAWALGYRHGVHTFPLANLAARHGEPVLNEAHQVRNANRWVFVSGIYFVLYGYSLLALYGADPGTLLDVISDPGAAYASKFETIEGLSTKTGNPVLQLLILMSLLQLPLGPLVGYFWDRLTTPVRVAAVAGFAVYSLFFFFIGTLQGLGFLLIGLASGLVARQYRVTTTDAPSAVGRTRRRIRIVMAVGFALFAVYMINAQAGRLEQFDVVDRFKPNPVVESVVGRDIARGLAVTVHYPTHGYRGLALNLDTAIKTPLLWTGGRGSSPAVDSYWEQYVGGSVRESTYPARTESVTGWSATTVWATVYPWLASDFTFFGVPFLMFLIGRWTARMWLRSIRFHDPLALMLFSQLALFVAFISVNNQVLISRPALLAVVSCVAVYFGRDLHTAVTGRRSELGWQIEESVSRVESDGVPNRQP